MKESSRWCLPCEDLGSSASVLGSEGAGSTLGRKKTEERLRQRIALLKERLRTCYLSLPGVGRGSLLGSYCTVLSSTVTL